LGITKGGGKDEEVREFQEPNPRKKSQEKNESKKKLSEEWGNE